MLFCIFSLHLQMVTFMHLANKTDPVVVLVNTSNCDDDQYNYLVQFADEYIKERICRLSLSQDKINCVVGCVLRKWLIYKFYGIAFKDQEIAFGDKGKPYLLKYNDIHFNISHSGEFVVCAIHNKPVGVDIQKVVQYNEKIARYMFSGEIYTTIGDCEDRKLKFTSLWSENESKCKLVGCGVSGMRNHNFDNIKTKQQMIDDYVITLSLYN